MILNNKVSLTFRFVLALILLFSGALKIIDLENFSLAIEKFNLLDKIFIPYITYLIPITEIIMGVFLIFNFKTYHTSIFSMYMISFFTAIVTAKIFEGADINCQCFGNLSDGKIDWSTIIRNIGIIIIGLIVAMTSFKEKPEKELNLTKSIRGKFNNNFLVLFKNLVFSLVFFFLAVQSIILAMQNRELKDIVDTLAMDKDILAINDTVNTTTVINLDNELMELNFETTDSLSLIFIISTKCEPCRLNLPGWSQLTEKVKNKLMR